MVYEMWNLDIVIFDVNKAVFQYTVLFYLLNMCKILTNLFIIKFYSWNGILKWTNYLFALGFLHARFEQTLTNKWLKIFATELLFITILPFTGIEFGTVLALNFNVAINYISYQVSSIYLIYLIYL